jgi:hypothetical protein
MTDALRPRKWVLWLSTMKPIEVNVVETRGISSRCRKCDGPTGIHAWIETAMLKDTAHDAVAAQMQYLNNRLTEDRLSIDKLLTDINKIRGLMFDYNLLENTGAI